jgi:hypothetical protein
MRHTILRLEREALVTLGRVPATKERIEHILATGKRVRN